MVLAASSVPSRLPIELYRDIIQHVAVRHLAALCTVSSILRHEAERVLYHTIQLSEPQRVRTWSLTIAGSERLGAMVHSLTLPQGFSVDIDQDAAKHVQESLRIALHKVINLKYLKITGGLRYPCLDLSLLAGCPFRLLGLSGNLAIKEIDALKFLSEQSDIHSWSPGLPFLFPPQSTRIIPNGILPHLSELKLDVSRMLAHIPKWPLRGLVVRIQHFGTRLDGIDRLHLFQDTLTSLRCYGDHASFDQLEQHILVIAKSVPKLKHLKYWLVLYSGTLMIYDLRNLLPSICQLTELETLLLMLHTVDNGPAGCKDSDHAREVARDFMICCPSLRRISFRAERATYLCFVKDPSGEVHMEAFSSVDEEWQWHA